MHSLTLVLMTTSNLAATDTSLLTAINPMPLLYHLSQVSKALAEIQPIFFVRLGEDLSINV